MRQEVVDLYCFIISELASVSLVGIITTFLNAISLLKLTLIKEKNMENSMKKTIIGCCLTTIGTLGDLVVMLSSGNNLVSGWSTPPGRFITTDVAIGMDTPFIISTIILVLGLIILAIEYFKKEK